MKLQRGFGLNTLMVGGAIFAVVALLAMKVLPPWMEYGNLVKAVKGTATDTSLQDATVAQVRAAFGRRADMDDVKSVTPQDLDITKEGGDLVISFSYSKKVPLFGNASLVFDFEGSSSAKR
jgi:Tfp pilus assembly protein PilE